MISMKPFYRVWLIFLFIGVSTSGAIGAESGALRVGAVKVDITPADPTKLTNLFQTQYAGVHDKIYARSVVVSNGIATAVIIAVDNLSKSPRDNGKKHACNAGVIQWKDWWNCVGTSTLHMADLAASTL